MEDLEAHAVRWPPLGLELARPVRSGERQLADHADALHTGTSLESGLETIVEREHLIALGHRRFMFLGGPEKSVDAVERFNGLREALSARGIDLDPGDVPFGQTFPHGGAVTVAEQWLAKPRSEAPTAVMCGNDTLAIEFLRVILQRGEGERQEVELVAPQERAADLPVPLCPMGSPALGEESLDEIPEPGTSPLDGMLDEVEPEEELEGWEVESHEAAPRDEEEVQGGDER